MRPDEYLMVGIEDARQLNVQVVNPVEHDIVIRSSEALPVDVVLYDCLGNTMDQATNVAGKMDASSIPAGLYIIELRSGTKCHRQKVVKL